jgi:hypothetical protein
MAYPPERLIWKWIKQALPRMNRVQRILWCSVLVMCISLAGWILGIIPGLYFNAISGRLYVAVARVTSEGFSFHYYRRTASFASLRLGFSPGPPHGGRSVANHFKPEAVLYDDGGFEVYAGTYRSHGFVGYLGIPNPPRPAMSGPDTGWGFCVPMYAIVLFWVVAVILPIVHYGRRGANEAGDRGNGTPAPAETQRGSGHVLPSGPGQIKPRDVAKDQRSC